MRKKHVLIKDFFREVKKSRNRFLSILVIVVLGVAFFSGIRATSPDMELSADIYYDDANLMDIRVLGTLGLTDDDVSELEKIPGVKAVEPSYSMDVLCRMEDSQPVLHLMTLTKELNQVDVKEGRLPEKADEIFVDQDFLKEYDYKVGDTIEVFSGEEGTDISEMLSVSQFTIVGAGTSPFYLSLDRGTSTIGDGTVGGFGVIPSESFSSEAYTEIYLSVEKAEEELCYGDAYENVVETVKNRIEEISEEQCEIRYADIKADSQEEIDQAKQEIADGKQELEDARIQLEDGEAQLEEGKNQLQEKEEELENGKNTLESERARLEEGKVQLADARKELENQAAVLNQKKAELEAGKQELAAQEQKLQTGMTQLEEGEQQIEAGEEQIRAAEQQIQTKEQEILLGEQNIQQGEQELAEGKQQLEETRRQLEAMAEQVEDYRQKLPVMKEQLNQMQTELDGHYETLAGYEQQLEQFQKEYEEALQNPDAEESYIKELENKIKEAQGNIADINDLITSLQNRHDVLQKNIYQIQQEIQRYDTAVEELRKGEEQIAGQEQLLAQSRQSMEEGKELLLEAKTELEQKKIQLEQSKAEVLLTREQLNEGRTQLEEVRQQLAVGEQQLIQGEQQLESARQLLESEGKQITEGESQLAASMETIEEGEQQIATARETLETQEQELQKAKEEFDQESLTAQDEINEGEEQIAEGQKELDELEIPTWYILGRDSIQTYVEYEQDSQRIEAIGKVFPAIFFLVAALICLTTMTRMVEENRTQIGTLKALGYSKAAIAAKYLFYALFASLVGSVIGFIGGQLVLPVIIIKAYGILYNNLPVIQAPVYAGYSISSTVLAVGITVLAAGFSCNRELKSVPATLMRPEAPKSGKRILLEKVNFIWKRLSFSNKATARNLFRYKKRFFMTVLGIGGCMGLLMVGFGLRDSIMAIGEKQFGEIRIYSATISLDMESSQEEREHVLEAVKDDSEVENWIEALESSIDVGYNGQERSSYMVVVSDLDKFKQFVTLQDRKSKEVYELDDEGVIITEKLAKLLDVKAGDTIYLKDGDSKQMEVTVSHVVENYFYHYVYMSPAVYEKLYGEPPTYTEIFTVNKDDTEAFEETFQTRYMDLPGVLNVSFLSTVNERISDMLRSMDAVIYVIVIAAGLLAFVVLYNLNNINISERRRELATLKVLGFYDKEVSQYVFRENIVLTLIGSMVGVVFGLILHRFVILTAEVDLMMFGRNIKFMSFCYSILLTFLFSFLVNLFMHFKLKKLDMVESMKSVE